MLNSIFLAVPMLLLLLRDFLMITRRANVFQLSSFEPASCFQKGLLQQPLLTQRFSSCSHTTQEWWIVLDLRPILDAGQFETDHHSVICCDLFIYFFEFISRFCVDQGCLQPTILLWSQSKEIFIIALFCTIVPKG